MGFAADLTQVYEARAWAFHDEGEPALAACCFIAHGEPTRAVTKLLRCHQLELALALALALALPALQLVLRMLAARAERYEQWPLAMQLLQRGREPSMRIPLLAARCAQASGGTTSTSPAVDLFGLASLPSAGSYRELAEAAVRSADDAEAVRRGSPQP